MAVNPKTKKGSKNKGKNTSDLPNPWEIFGEPPKLPGIGDEYMRFKVEQASQQALRQLFRTSVENTKDPIEKERLRALMNNSNTNGQGMNAHPILAKHKQFSNREVNMLPTMDPEQLDRYLQNEYQKKYVKDLQKRNENEMSLKAK
jgi:hypothetical protein